MNKFLSKTKKLYFKDVLIVPKNTRFTSRRQINLVSKYKFKCGQEWEGIPLMVANMDTTGTFEIAKVCSQYKILTVLHKHYHADEIIYWAEKNPECLEYISLSTGTSQKDISKIEMIIKKIPQIKWICLDIANGYCPHFIDTIKSLRKLFPNKIIMAGNVVTPERTMEILSAGADLVKEGIGGGSVCVTRNKTGIGYPQLSVCLENNKTEIGVDYSCIISDGGCKEPSDIAKAISGGADFVMLGGMFAGHDESGGETFEENGKKYKLFYGMSSDTAMKKHHGGVADYRASEGKTIKVESKGAVENTIKDILGGLRSTCTYTNSKDLIALEQNAKFILV